MKLANKIRNPNALVWVIASMIIIFNSMNLAAIIGPSFVTAAIVDTDNSLSILDIKNAFSTYLQEAGTQLSLDQTEIKQHLIISGIFSVLFIFNAAFLGARKRWARIFVICLVGLQLSLIIGFRGFKSVSFPVDFYIFYTIILVMTTGRAGGLISAL